MITMTDSELLEAAARAVGLDCTIYPGGYVLRRDANTGLYHSWNPLESDADALRLAVDLGLNVDTATAAAWALRFRGTVFVSVDYDSDDKHAATRRAITLAAAQIGGQDND